MKRSLLSILRCPGCPGGQGRLVEEAGGEVIAEGTLRCAACGTVYPIRRGIPSLLKDPPPSIRRHLEGIAEERRTSPGTVIWGWTAEEAEERIRVLPDGPWAPPGFRSAGANFRQVLPLLTPRPGERLLDIGADTCWTTAALARRGYEAVAVDIVEDHLALGRAFLHDPAGPHFERLVADMNQLPFADEVFDIVFATAAVHHAHDLEGAFREAARVLRPRGRVVLINEPVRSWMSRNGEFGAGEPHATENHWSQRQFAGAARRAGLAPRVLFPRSAEETLRDPKRARERLGRLGPAVSALWKVPGTPFLVARLLHPLVPGLLATTLVMRAHKPAAGPARERAGGAERLGPEGA